MSNATDTIGCLSHRRNSRFFILFEDFLDVAKVSSHQYKLAAFWRIMETKTNDRITYLREKAEIEHLPFNLPEEIWIELSYKDCITRSLGLYKASSFQVAVAESERLGFSKSKVLQRKVRPNDESSPMEDYKVYLFCLDVMQLALNKGDIPPPIENNSPLLKPRKRGPLVENNNPPLIENNKPPLLKSIGNNNIRERMGNKDSFVSDDTPLLEKILGLLKDADEETRTTLLAELSKKEEPSIPATPTLFPEEIPKQEKSPIVEQAENVRRSFWQARINGWRGSALPTKGECINETRCIKALVAEYTDAQIDAIIRCMLPKWPYKNDPRAIGAREIQKEAGPVSGTLKDQKAWPDATVKLETPVEVTSNVVVTTPVVRYQSALPGPVHNPLAMKVYQPETPHERLTEEQLREEALRNRMERDRIQNPRLYARNIANKIYTPVMKGNA